MPLTVDYALRRDEVWAIYWRGWGQRLWRTHLFLFAAIAICLSLILFNGAPRGTEGWALVVASGLAPLAFLIFYPQLRFKAETRTLTFTEDGIATRIGERSGTIGWHEIASVTQSGDGVVLQHKRGNAFFVPARAFASPQAADTFASEAEHWLKPRSVANIPAHGHSPSPPPA